MSVTMTTAAELKMGDMFAPIGEPIRSHYHYIVLSIYPRYVWALRYPELAGIPQRFDLTAPVELVH